MKRLVIFIITFYILLYNLNAVNIKGLVLDSANKRAISGASVKLIDISNENTIGQITKSDGRFIFNKLTSGKYILRITFVGYNEYEKFLRLKNKDRDLGKILLSEKPEELDEVEVIGKKPVVELKGDTTQFNADAFKTHPDANAEDLVQKMPGVVVQDGKIQAQGEDVKKVLMDGKPFFGQDPKAALKNIPAEIVDKVQVYDEQSEQSQFTGFDDGNTAKTLNIITRKNMRFGQFGKAYVGYGTDDRYQAGTNFNIFGQESRVSFLAQFNNVNQQNFAIEDILGAVSSFSPRFRIMGKLMRGGSKPRGGNFRFRGGGVNVRDFLVDQQDGITKTNAFGTNYSDEWGDNIQVTGSYFVNYSNNDAQSNLFRDYFMGDTSSQIYKEQSYSSNNNLNHRFNLRFDWDVDTLNSILIIPKVTFQTNDGGQSTIARTDLNDRMLNNATNDFNSNLAGYNLNNYFLWRHKFLTKGRTFSASVNTFLNSNDGDNELASQSFYFDNFVESDTLDQIANLETQGSNIRYKLSYTEPIMDNSLLEFFYNGSINSDNSDKETNVFNDIDSSYTLLDTSLTNKFKSNYFSQNAGVNYQYKTGKANLTLGLSEQWSKLENTQEYPFENNLSKKFNNLLPSIRFQFRFSRMQNFRLFYRASTDIPSISQLQEVVNNSNPLQLYIGNSNLEESYQHSLFMNYMSVDRRKFSNFFIMAGLRYSDNYIGEKTIFAMKDSVLPGGYLMQQGSQLSTPVNLSGYWDIRSFINYGVPVEFISSNLNFNSGISYTVTPGLINDIENKTYNTRFTIGLVLSSNISENLDFTIKSFSNINYVENSVNTSMDNQYFNQFTSFRINLFLWEKLVMNSDIRYNYYYGYSEAFDWDYVVWNAYIGYKVFNNNGEIRLSAVDVLNQNSSVNRSVTDLYIEDSHTNVLQRYLMLSFIYTFRNFGV